MEGRILPPPPPPPPLFNDETPVPTQHRLYRIDDDEDNVELQYLPKGRNDTYVVQMPKDTIYWVPPAENAERARPPPPPTHKCSRLPITCICYTAITLIIISTLVLVSFIVYKFTLTPKPPLFVIKDLSFKENPRPHHAPPLYTLGIQATNPNNVNSLVYMPGTIELLLKRSHVASGPSPTLVQEPRQIDDFEVTLHGRSEVVPEAIRKGAHVKLDLSFSFMINKKTWLMNHRDIIVVKCEFVVDRVAHQEGSTTVKSQMCDYF